MAISNGLQTASLLFFVNRATCRHRGNETKGFTDESSLRWKSYRMLFDIMRFIWEAQSLLRQKIADPMQTLSEFLDRGRYSDLFRHEYLLVSLLSAY